MAFPITLTVTRLTVDNHYQAEFLHLLHEVALAVRIAAAHGGFTDEQRARLAGWREALRNHAEADLADLPNRAELVLAAVQADFLRVTLSDDPDPATPADGEV
jgi:hypothetical protein